MQNLKAGAVFSGSSQWEINTEKNELKPTKDLYGPPDRVERNIICENII